MPEDLSTNARLGAGNKLCLRIALFANLPGFCAVQRFANFSSTFSLHPVQNKGMLERLKRVPR